MSLLIHVLFRKVITYSRCVFMFRLNAILFHAIQLRISFIPEMEKLSLSYENAMIGCDIGA